MRALILASLVGVLHVHHAPSHDSDAPFAAVLSAARGAGLDFVVLAEHAETERGPLPAADRAGLYPDPEGAARPVLVMVGAELATRDGHLLAYDLPELVPWQDRPGREVIAAIHAAGGFAVVSHPFTHGGWMDWDAPFDGMEVHNHASDFRRLLGPLLPLRIVQLAFDRDAVLRRMLVPPQRELERWEALLLEGRRVVAFSGADAHQNLSLLGWQLDPYAVMFRLVHTVCPDGPLDADFLWQALRSGACVIRYELFADAAASAHEIAYPSGRSELRVQEGSRLLEIRNPILVAP